MKVFTHTLPHVILRNFLSPELVNFLLVVIGIIIGNPNELRVIKSEAFVEMKDIKLSMTRFYSYTVLGKQQYCYCSCNKITFFVLGQYFHTTINFKTFLGHINIIQSLKPNPFISHIFYASHFSHSFSSHKPHRRWLNQINNVFLLS